MIYACKCVLIVRVLYYIIIFDYKDKAILTLIYFYYYRNVFVFVKMILDDENTFINFYRNKNS